MASVRDDEDPLQCITSHEWFDACLNPATLETAYRRYRSQYDRRAAEGGKSESIDQCSNAEEDASCINDKIQIEDINLLHF